MFTTLLCIAFSNLSFNGLTLPILFHWYCLHPFLFIFAILEIVSEAKTSEVTIKKGV